MSIRYKVSPRRTGPLSENNKAIRQLLLMAGGIILLIGLFYFWFFIATANINNFWGLFRRGDNEATSAGLLNATPPAPTLTEVPKSTNQKSINIKGFSEAGAKVSLFVNEINTTQTIVDTAGSFTFNEVGLGSGSITVYVKTKNDKGLESAPSKAYTIVFDDKSPKLEVTKPQDGDKFVGPTPFYTVEGSLNEAATVFVNDRMASVDSDKNFRLMISLKEGDNFLKIKATDKAGNTSEIDRKLIYEKP